MAGLSDYAENELLDHILGIGSYAMPTTYLGLYTAAPSDAGGGTPVSGTGYARVALAGKFSVAADGEVVNDTAIEFPTAGSSWGTVTHFGIFDHSSAGNLLIWGTVSPNKTIGIDVDAYFAPGELTITMD